MNRSMKAKNDKVKKIDIARSTEAANIKAVAEDIGSGKTVSSWAYDVSRYKSKKRVKPQSRYVPFGHKSPANGDKGLTFKVTVMSSEEYEKSR